MLTLRQLLRRTYYFSEDKMAEIQLKKPALQQEPPQNSLFKALPSHIQNVAPIAPPSGGPAIGIPSQTAPLSYAAQEKAKHAAAMEAYKKANPIDPEVLQEIADSSAHLMGGRDLAIKTPVSDALKPVAIDPYENMNNMIKGKSYR